jgi:hypothetical protein
MKNPTTYPKGTGPNGANSQACWYVWGFHQKGFHRRTRPTAVSLAGSRASFIPGSYRPTADLGKELLSPSVLLIGAGGLQRTARTQPIPDADHAAGDVPENDPFWVRAAETFAQDLAANRIPPIREIRGRLHAGQPRAQQVRAYLSRLAHG